jgi:hypothetical protein
MREALDGGLDVARLWELSGAERAVDDVPKPLQMVLVLVFRMLQGADATRQPSAASSMHA